MANTKSSAKRALQNEKRRIRNQAVRSETKTALKKAISALQSKDGNASKTYIEAVKTLAKAGTKGALPKARAARKISRLTHLAKKIFPEALSK